MKNAGLITGASSGIGMELAKIHASKGRDLILVARRVDELMKLKTELESSFKIKVEVIPMDLMKENAADSLFQLVQEKNIQVDYLFNNAGLGGYGKFHERDLKKEREMIQLNIIALTELTHLFLPGMLQRKSGKILNTASTAGFLPGPMQSVYFATKAFVVSFTQGVAQEVCNDSVTLTALCPGPVKTEFEKAAGMEGSGLFKSAKTAESTARKGYRAMEKGKLIAISDNSLKFALNWALPFAPRKLVLKMIQNMQTIK
jgi:short-subunit dehydrogenase